MTHSFRFAAALAALLLPAVAGASDYPAGITFQSTRTGPILADAQGRALYTFDEDKDGKPTCVAECAAAWPALAAPAEARPVGAFTPVERADGGRQWAWKGKPLYTFAKDERVGEARGETPGGKWRAASNRAGVGLVAPDGIKATESLLAGGQVLIDESGLTLYAYTGDLKDDRTVCAGDCAGGWIPVPAAALANPVGDFTIATRPDGTRQWAHRGRPLYRYATDTLPSEVKGLGVDARWQPALLARYPMPADVTLRPATEHGAVFADTAGRTLYIRDRYRYTGPGGHNTDATRPIPQLGRALGTLTCEGECAKTWVPLAAPADAQPTGLWSIVTRRDGARQWAYLDYPLYTFAGDAAPGDMTGYDRFVLTDGGNALYWRFARP